MPIVSVTEPEPEVTHAPEFVEVFKTKLKKQSIAMNVFDRHKGGQKSVGDRVLYLLPLELDL